MTAKEFFRQVKRAESELKMLNAKYHHYEDLGLSLGGIAGGIGGRQKGASRVELAACGAVDALRAIDEQRQAYMAVIAKAEAIIKSIPQEKYRLILNYRYLCGWSFRSISDELAYNDPNSVYRAHGWALSEAQKVLNREEREKEV